MLARLPARLDPIVDFDLGKAHYARFSERLYGRVTMKETCLVGSLC